MGQRRSDDGSLRAHLHVEYMTRHLQHVNPTLGDLDEARLSYAQKVNLLSSSDKSITSMIGGVRHLNRVRNRLAHNLDAVITEADKAVFLAQAMFRALRNASMDEYQAQLSVTHSTSWRLSPNWQALR